MDNDNNNTLHDVVSNDQLNIISTKNGEDVGNVALQLEAAESDLETALKDYWNGAALMETKRKENGSGDVDKPSKPRNANRLRSTAGCIDVGKMPSSVSVNFLRNTTARGYSKKKYPLDDYLPPQVDDSEPSLKCRNPQSTLIVEKAEVILRDARKQLQNLQLDLALRKSHLTNSINAAGSPSSSSPMDSEETKMHIRRVVDAKIQELEATVQSRLQSVLNMKGQNPLTVQLIEPTGKSCSKLHPSQVKKRAAEKEPEGTKVALGKPQKQLGRTAFPRTLPSGVTKEFVQELTRVKSSIDGTYRIANTVKSSLRATSNNVNAKIRQNPSDMSVFPLLSSKLCQDLTVQESVLRSQQARINASKVKAAYGDQEKCLSVESSQVKQLQKNKFAHQVQNKWVGNSVYMCEPPSTRKVSAQSAISLTPYRHSTKTPKQVKVYREIATNTSPLTSVQKNREIRLPRNALVSFKVQEPRPEPKSTMLGVCSLPSVEIKGDMVLQRLPSVNIESVPRFEPDKKESNVRLNCVAFKDVRDEKSQAECASKSSTSTDFHVAEAANPSNAGFESPLPGNNVPCTVSEGNVPYISLIHKLPLQLFPDGKDSLKLMQEDKDIQEDHENVPDMFQDTSFSNLLIKMFPNGAQSGSESSSSSAAEHGEGFPVGASLSLPGRGTQTEPSVIQFQDGLALNDQMLTNVIVEVLGEAVHDICNELANEKEENENEVSGSQQDETSVYEHIKTPTPSPVSEILSEEEEEELIVPTPVRTPELQQEASEEETNITEDGRDEEERLVETPVHTPDGMSSPVRVETPQPSEAALPSGGTVIGENSVAPTPLSTPRKMHDLEPQIATPVSSHQSPSPPYSPLAPPPPSPEQPQPTSVHADTALQKSPSASGSDVIFVSSTSYSLDIDDLALSEGEVLLGHSEEGEVKSVQLPGHAKAVRFSDVSHEGFHDEFRHGSPESNSISVGEIELRLDVLGNIVPRMLSDHRSTGMECGQQLSIDKSEGEVSVMMQ